MGRYAWKAICKPLNTYGLYDSITHSFVIETTEKGMKAYKKNGLNFETEETKVYIDIESGETITTEQRYSEYMRNRQEQPDEYNYSFAEYIRNSLTTNNGTLERIN